MFVTTRRRRAIPPAECAECGALYKIRTHRRATYDVKGPKNGRGTRARRPAGFVRVTLPRMSGAPRRSWFFFFFSAPAKRGWNITPTRRSKHTGCAGIRCICITVTTTAALFFREKNKTTRVLRVWPVRGATRIKGHTRVAIKSRRWSARRHDVSFRIQLSIF